jgi:hypothetical protein
MMPRPVLQRYAGLLVIVVGLLFLSGGFLYDILFAGIPYQDPPPALQQQYAASAATAQTFYIIGIVIVLLGIVITVVQRMRQRG